MRSSGSIGERGKVPACSADPVGHADMLIAQLGESTSIQLVALYANNWPPDTYWQRVLARLQEQQRKATEMLRGGAARPGRAPPRRQGAAPIPLLLNRDKTHELYGELCPVLAAICGQIDALSVPLPPSLADWRHWAGVFMAGLYSRKTVLQAVEAAALAPAPRSASDAIALLSRAATQAATAVLHAIDGDHALASKAAASARRLAESRRETDH